MKRPRVLWVLAGGLLLLLIAFYSARVLRYYPETRVEFGRARLIRLDEATRQRLRNLEHEALVTYYVSRRDRLPSEMRRLERHVADLLGEMQRESKGRFHYQIVDPETDPGFAGHAAHQRVAPYRARTVRLDGYEEQTVWSTLHIAFGPYPAAVINGVSPAHLPRLQSILLEQLNQMSRPRRPVFALAAPAGYEELKAALAARGQVKRVNLSDGSETLNDVDVLFWMEPGAIDPLLSRRVNQFLENGGSVVIAGSKHEITMSQQNGSPVFDIQSSGNQAEAFMASLGLRLRAELVLDSFSREITVGDLQHPARFLIRGIAPNQDFRTLTDLPNGDLLFAAPTPFEVDGEVLAERGYNAVVLATTSEDTTTREMKYGPIPFGSAQLEPGEATPKLPLMVWLRPNESWQGSLIAAASATPFRDGYFAAEGFAHQRLLGILCDTLASADRLVLHRAGIQRATLLPEFTASQRLFWRGFCVFLAPVFLAGLAWKRGAFSLRERASASERPTGTALAWPAAGAGLGMLVSIAAVSGLGWRFDASAEKVNQLSAAAGKIARKAVGDNAARVTVYFSRPEHLPPELRRRARSVKSTLRTLHAAGAELGLAWIHPEDLSQVELDRLTQSGVTPTRLTSRGEEVTSTRTFYSTIRLSSRDRTELVRLNDSAAFEQLEFRLAFAMWRLQTGRQPHIAFIADLPRLSPAEALEDFQKKSLLAPAGTDVYSLARAALEQAGFRVTHIHNRNPKLPADIDLIVWMQPRRNIRPLLDQVVPFLHRGGRVLIAAQHFNMQARQYQGAGFKSVYWPQPQTPDIDQYYFPKLGIELVREVLFDDLKAPLALQTQVNRSREERDYLDEVSALPFMIRAASANFAARHPTTRGLGDQILPFPNYLRLDSKLLAAQGLRVTPLITTSARTWTYPWKGGWLPEESLRGPGPAPAPTNHWLGRLPLAVLFEGRFPLPQKPFSDQTDDPGLAASPTEGQTGKLLLLGCSHLFRNERFTDSQFRADHLLLNAVSWLALNEDLAMVATHRATTRGLNYVAPERRLRWRVLVLSITPMALLVFGLIWRFARQWPLLPGKSRLLDSVPSSSGS